ncbi:MAG: hypothetical protein R2939_13565 [Kofleriaceae bacterium]
MVVLAGLAAPAMAQGEAADPPAAGRPLRPGEVSPPGHESIDEKLRRAAPPAAPVAAGGEPAAMVMPLPTDAQVAPPSPPPSLAELRATCADAMNHDPSFAEAILAEVRKDHAEELLAQETKAHQAHAAAIAKNQRHVILAYAAMWLLAVGFIVFLWRRHARLRAQLDQLARDLEHAARS